jgi:hypothetical protein
MGCAISAETMPIPGGMIRKTQRAIKNAIDVEYLTIVQEESSIHFHLWFFPWSLNVIEQYGEPSLTRIRDIMADQRKQPIGESQWGELKKSFGKIKAQMISNIPF